MLKPGSRRRRSEPVEAEVGAEPSSAKQPTKARGARGQRDAESEKRPYYMLTLAPEQVAEQLRLEDDVTAAESTLTDLEAQRGALDAELAKLAQEAEFRRKQRHDLTTQRDQLAAEANIDAVANSTRLIDATELVDIQRGKLADHKRQERQKLDERTVAASQALSAAQKAVAEFSRENRGRVARFLVDYFVRREVHRYMEQPDSDLDTGDSVMLASAISELPDMFAEAIAAEPGKYAALMQADLTPKPKPRPTVQEARAMIEQGEQILFETERAERARQDVIRYTAEDRARTAVANAWALP